MLTNSAQILVFWYFCNQDHNFDCLKMVLKKKPTVLKFLNIKLVLPSSAKQSEVPSEAEFSSISKLLHTPPHQENLQGSIAAPCQMILSFSLSKLQAPATAD